MTPPRREERSERPALLDVNVLIALAWPNHEGHATAHRWFADESAAGWATTPITETGFVRVSCDRRALPTVTTPGRAVQLLRRMVARPGHQFWGDELRYVTGPHVDPDALRGYRQITDAHLVALTAANRGRFVTFDQAIAAIPGVGQDMVQVLQPSG